MGVKPLKRIQFGPESTPGTAVAATALYRGVGSIDDKSNWKDVEEDVGLLVPTTRQVQTDEFAEFSMGSVEASFEQINYPLEGGLLKIGTGVADGAGSGKIYTYPIPTSSEPTIQTYTLEGGDDKGAEEVEYAYCQSFKLSGAARDTWMLEQVWEGRKPTPTTFTPALTLPVVSDMAFNKSKLYIDDVSGSFGTTQVSNTFMKAELSFTTGIIPVFTGDGNLYFTLLKRILSEIELKITFEHNASAIAEKAKWKAGTPRLIEIEIIGPALASAGTAYSFKTVRIQLAGVWKKFDPLEDDGGNNVVNGTFKGAYDLTAGEAGNIIVVNELTTIP